MKKNDWVRQLTYGIIILVGPFMAYYLVYVQAREDALLDRTYSHLTNITARTEARFNSVFTVIRNACTESQNFSNVIDQNALGLRIKQADYCLNLKNEPDSVNRLVKPITRERMEFTFGNVILYANTNELVGAVDLGDRFHDIFIFDNNNNIVYQKKPGNGRIDNLAELTNSNASNESKKSIINDPLDSIRVNYRGRWYLMPSQPLQIDFNFVKNSEDAQNSTADNNNWLMVGLLDESKFNADKLKFQPDTVAWIVLLVATVILIGPFLKVWYLGRFETFKKMDVVLLIAAGFTLCSLLTLVVIQIYSRAGLNQFLHQRLNDISNQMVLEIRQELSNTVEELQRADIAMRGVFSKVSNEEFSSSDTCAYFAKDTQAEQMDGATWAGDLLNIEKSNYHPQLYPFFNMSYLMDQKGCQIVKWSTLSKPTNAARFSDREYFLRPLANARLPSQLYTIDGHQFFLEFITSRTTGEKTVAVSIPVGGDLKNESDRDAREQCLSSPLDISKPCVAVFTSSSLRSLETVMPYGFGFALIDSSGALLAHHKGNTNTEINLISELGEGSLLQAELYSQSTGQFSSDYQGHLHQFIVTPLNIEGADISLVTFYSENIALTPLFESLGTTLIAWLFWFTVLFSIALTIWQWNKFLDGQLFASIGRALKRYEVLLLSNTVAVLVLCLYHPPLSLIAPIYIVPVLLLWLFKISKNFRSRPFSVVVVSWVLMLSGSSLPIWGLYQSIASNAFSGYLQLHIQDYHHQKNRQRQIIQQWLVARDTSLSDPNYEAFVHGDFSSTNDIVKIWSQHPLFTSDQLSTISCLGAVTKDNYIALSTEKQNTVSLWRFLLSKLPDFSDESIQLHAMYRNNKNIVNSDNSCSAKLVSDSLRGSLILGHSRGIASTIGSIFLVILGAGLWYVLVRTLGLRTENYLRLLNFKIPEKNSAAREVIYGLGEYTKGKFFRKIDPKRICWVNLRALSNTEVDQIVDSLLLSVKKASETESNQSYPDIVIIDHFDDCLIDKSVLIKRIELTEKLLPVEKLSIVLLMTIDPLSFVTSTFDTEQEAPLISRMASCLTQFNVSHYQESPPEKLGASKEELTLREECYHPNLSAIYYSIHDQSSQKQLDSNEIIQLVKSRANSIYQQMWNLCTRAEKIMLVELAHDNLVNPNNWDIARRLKQRGYLRRDPFHRIFSESFKQFILRMERVENIDVWRAESASTWSNIRTPLFALVIAAIIFLAVTQPSFFNSVFAFAAAGTASLPFLVNLIMAKLKSSGEK